MSDHTSQPEIQATIEREGLQALSDLVSYEGETKLSDKEIVLKSGRWDVVAW